MNYAVWAYRITLFQLFIAIGGSLSAEGASYNVGLFVLGLWAIESGKADPSLIYVGMILITLVFDWVWLGVYADDIIDADGGNKYARTSKYSLSMTIIGHIIKPVTSSFSYFVFRERQESPDFSGNANQYEHTDPAPSAPVGDAQYSGFA